MSPGSILAAFGAWGFMAMIAIAVVCAVLVALIEAGWVTPPRDMKETGPGHHFRDLLTGSSLRAMGVVGWLAWLGMLCGIFGAAGMLIGVPWMIHDDGVKRDARQAADDELIRRLCGDLRPYPTSRRVLEGLVSQNPIVVAEVSQRWKAYVATVGLGLWAR